MCPDATDTGAIYVSLYRPKGAPICVKKRKTTHTYDMCAEATDTGAIYVSSYRNRPKGD
jgi:hypothetical protein